MKRSFIYWILGAGMICFCAFSPALFAEGPSPDATTPETPVVEAEVVPPPSVAQEDGTGTAPVIADDTISLDFKDAEIGSVLRVLSMKSNVNIVAGPEVKGLVTVRLENVPWEKALGVILRTYDYVFERDGNIIRITTRDKMKLEPVQTKTFILNYSKAAEIQASIQDILTERGRVKVSERTNMVVVTDIPTNLYNIGEVISKLDTVTPQAFIDSKIIKTDVSNTEKLGINWNVEGGLTRGSTRPTTFPFTQTSQAPSPILNQFFPVLAGTSATGTAADYIVNPTDARGMPYVAKVTGSQPSLQYGTLDFSTFTAMLNFLQSRTNTKAISNPRIVVLNNQTAQVKVGQEIPIPAFERNETTGSMEITGFTYRDTGVVLNVTPHINSAEEILVELAPEVSAVGPNQEFGAGQIQAPRFDTTKANTQVLIQSGQTIAIGGLLSDSTGTIESKVPVLGDIPIVGKLFRSKNPSGESTGVPSTQKVETLFFVTVTMVDSQGQPVSTKFDGKNDQSKDDRAQQKTAAADAGASLNSPSQTIPTAGSSAVSPV